MDFVLNWGIQVIERVQTVKTPFLDYLFISITDIGNPLVFIYITVVIYWCLDRKAGIRLGFLILLSSFINASLKEFLKQPRPDQLPNHEGISIIKQDGYGLPSAHAQISMVFWGYLGSFLDGKKAAMVIIIPPFLIGFSRIYLGVHFPTDVFAGWILGALAIITYHLFGKNIVEFYSKHETRRKITINFLITAIMVAIDNQNLISSFFLGASCGHVMLCDKYNYSPPGSIHNKIMCLMVGTFTTILTAYVLYLFMPDSSDIFFGVIKFLYGTICGLWISFGAPFLFIKTGLSKKT